MTSLLSRGLVEELNVDLTGRVAIVTGAAQGIGAVYARYLTSAGCRTIVADVNHKLGQELAVELHDEFGSSEFVELDVSDERSVSDAVEIVVNRYDKIDILINNAALFSALIKKPFEQISLEEWRRVMQVNVDGTFLMTRAVMPHMRRRSYGRIVNISSTTVPMGRINYLHYVTSKAAVLGITRSVAREVGDCGITVNALMPTLIETGVETQVVSEATFDYIRDRQSIKRNGKPEDLARTLLFLVSADSGFITGQTIVVDGGGIHL